MSDTPDLSQGAHNIPAEFMPDPVYVFEFADKRLAENALALMKMGGGEFWKFGGHEILPLFGKTEEDKRWVVYLSILPKEPG